MRPIPLASHGIMSQSALIVVVPEAEPWVGSLRSQYDSSARLRRASGAL